MTASGRPVDLPMLDDEVTKLPEDFRRDIAEAAAADLYSFVRGVLKYRDVTKSCHGPLCAWHDSNPSRFKLTLMPRGHLKTSVLTIGKTIQRVVQNPERRILLANETATNAERFLGLIKSHAESNRIFRTLYSHVIPQDTRSSRWSQQELLFARQGHYPEPTIDTIGMTGAMTSRHYTDMAIDDPVSEEAARSRLVMEDVINRVGAILNMMSDPGKDNFDLTGTRWGIFDVYSVMEQRLGTKLARFIRAAIEEDKPIWPERFSLDVLADIRATMADEYKWSCLMMNRPRDVANQDFNVQDLRFWKWAEDEEHIIMLDKDGQSVKTVAVSSLDVTLTVDVRYGERSNSDRDAVVAVGATDDGDAIVLDAWAERSNPLAVIDHLVWLIKRYSPRVLGIQKVGYEMSLKWHLQAAMEREGLYVRVQPVRPGGPGKPHIRGLQAIASTGHLYLSPSQMILRQELDDYPLGKNDDVADALALQQQLWRGLLSADRMKRYKESEDKILRGIGRPDIIALSRPDDRGHMPSADDIGIDEEDSRYGAFHDFILQ